jgi:hypothetical protein
MKHLFLSLLITSWLLSCTSSSDKTNSADTMATADKTLPALKQSNENLALINNFLTAIENLDTAAMSLLMADNYKGYGPSIGDSAGKPEILENWKYNFDHHYASIKYTRYQNFATTITETNVGEPGEWVSNSSYCSVKYKDGKGPIFLWVNSIFKIENGKILKSRVFYNEADWSRQMGSGFMKPIKKKEGESL